MDNKTLAGQGLQVRCIDRTSTVPAGDQACCQEALWQARRAGLLAPWRGQLTLAAQDYVVLVNQTDSGRLLGMLTASERHTGAEPFLLLESAFVAPQARGYNLLQRMVAVVLLSVARFEWKPAALVACARRADAARNLLSLRDHIPATSSFPRSDAAVIELAAAGIARRAARVVQPWSHYAASSGRFLDRTPECQLLVLSLDMADEARVTAGARRLYQRRPTKQAVEAEFVFGDLPVVALPAHTPRDGAMR